MRLPWQHRPQVVTPETRLSMPTDAKEKEESDRVLTELRNLSVLSLRTELLLRQHMANRRAHRQTGAEDGEADG